MQNLLILFAKAPRRGQVKTRLVPFITKEAACRLQEAFIIDTLHRTDSPSWDKAVACAPTPRHPFFSQCGQTQSLQWIQQEGRDLGERMAHAFAWGFSGGYQKVVVIGCDAPTLPVSFISDAFSHLCNVPWVVGPSTDGGYYLIGGVAVHPRLFENIPWGTGQVLLRTLKRMNEDKLAYHLLPFWYDIDRPDDLRFLKEHLHGLEKEGASLPKETCRFIQSLSGEENR